MLTVGEVMERRFLTVRETDRIGPILDWMDKYKIRVVPVLNDKKKLVGMISERQLYRGLFLQEYDPLQVIEDIVNRQFITAHQEEDWIQVAKRLRIYNQEIVPVVEKGTVIGIITQDLVVDQFITKII